MASSQISVPWWLSQNVVSHRERSLATQALRGPASPIRSVNSAIGMMLRQLGRRCSAHVRVGRVGSPVLAQYSASAAPSPAAPVYVVFGSTGGIGSALCKRLALQPDSHLVLVARDLAKVDRLKEQLVTPGTTAGIDPAKVACLTADVTDSKQVDEAIAKAVEQFGRIDAVANCVGSIVLKSAHTTSDAEFDQVIKLNLNSCFNILRSSVKRMMTNGGGSIVFCSSAVARHGIPNHEAIAAAKAGVSGLALSAAATYAPKNIRVNCVAPGLTKTPLAARITGNPAALKASESMHALKRVGEADEVAAALEFLLHPGNCFITGQVLGVDGGLGSLRPH